MTPRPRRLRPIGVAVVLVVLTVLGGCSYDGITAIPLPLREGTGDDAFPVSVEMAEISGLGPNAEVKVDDVTVGTVDATSVQNWTALLELRLNGSVELPANATARIGQKSLLGAKYVELTRPEEPPVGRLRAGDRIPLSRTGRYPETEEVLAALGFVLNGSGLAQVKTIVDELDTTLTGRRVEAREVLGNFEELFATLDDQRGEITTALDELRRLSEGLRERNDVVARALDTIPPALESLNADRDQLVETLRAVGDLSTVGDRVVGATRDDLLANLRALQPALGRLADSGQDLTQSLPQVVTFPFPATTSFPSMFRGDYANLFLSLDLSPELILRSFTTGFQLPVPGGPSLLAAPPLGRGLPSGSVLDPFGGDAPAGTPQAPGDADDADAAPGPAPGPAPEPAPAEDSGPDPVLPPLLGGDG